MCNSCPKPDNQMQRPSRPKPQSPTRDDFLDRSRGPSPPGGQRQQRSPTRDDFLDSSGECPGYGKCGGDSGQQRGQENETMASDTHHRSHSPATFCEEPIDDLDRLEYVEKQNVEEDIRRYQKARRRMILRAMSLQLAALPEKCKKKLKK